MPREMVPGGGGPSAASLDRVAIERAVRVPDLDGSGRWGGHVCTAGVGPGMGSEGDVVVRHVGDLRGLPSRALDVGMEGHPAAIVALVGFVSLLIAYYAVNLWIVGLHSYKGF